MHIHRDGAITFNLLDTGDPCRYDVVLLTLAEESS